MKKRIFILHGWGGHNKEGWIPWLKEQLEPQGFEVHCLQMPNTDEPEIRAWVSYLNEQVGTPDQETHFVAHSIGGQTVLRYLATLAEEVKVGKIILVGPWTHLTEKAFKEDPEDRDVARPWLETLIDWEKSKQHSDEFVALFGDDDPYVPLSEAKIFEEKLGAKVIIEKGKGHLQAEHGVTEYPLIIDLLNK